jgi:hypothetical protein
VHKLYGKLAAHPELITMLEQAIAEWWHANNSRIAKLAYQQKLLRQQQQGGK